MTELLFHVSPALILGKLRAGAAGARGQVHETAVLKQEEQAGGLAAPSPNPTVTGWPGREGARGRSPGQQYRHWAERKEVLLAGVWCLKEEALPGPAEPRLGPYSADLPLLGPSPELLEN